MFRLHAPSLRTMEVCRSHSLTLLPRPAPSGRLQYMEEFPMRILLSTVALATLLSSTADAQYGVGRGYYRAYAQVPPYAAYRSNGFYRAYAQAPYYRTPASTTSTAASHRTRTACTTFVANILG